MLSKKIITLKQLMKREERERDGEKILLLIKIACKTISALEYDIRERIRENQEKICDDIER